MHKSCLLGIRALLVGSVAVMSINAAVAAQDAADLALQSQPMADALRRVAEVTHSNIMFTPEAVAGIQAPSVRGRMDAAQAVNALTKGSDLEVVADGWGGLIVRPSAHIMTQVPVNAGGGAAASVEQVTVTGSRVITSIAQSPTPLTVVSTEQLQSTTPTDIPDALNKLPVFQGSSQPRTAGNGGTAGGINVLNLRNFGVQRTLVLFDSHRVAPANANGTVDVDTLPQLLLSRVDVVTGGASAVYGSDAITGVVNFVLDKHFNGFKFDVNSGISNYADGFSYKLAGAFGTDLFGGRGHFEASLEHFSQDGVQETDRPYGPQYWSLTGAGTAANPYVQTINARNATASFGGLITCSACTVNGQQFVGNGVLGPFVHGQATGTGSVESGGDGAYNPYGQVITPFRTDTAFGRLSYNIDDTTTAYIQASGSEAYATGTWYPTNMITGANTASIFYANNPFLPPSIQQALNPANAPNKTFQLTKFIVQFGKQGSPGTRNVNLYRTAAAGLDGTLWGKFDWDVYYSHGESRQDVTNYRNPNNQRWYASEDATLNSAGQVVCYVSTTPYASLYPGCVPIDLSPKTSSKNG